MAYHFGVQAFVLACVAIGIQLRAAAAPHPDGPSIHVYIQYTYIYIYICYIYICTLINMYIYVCVRTYLYILTCINAYMYIYICIHIFTYIPIYHRRRPPRRLSFPLTLGGNRRSYLITGAVGGLGLITALILLEWGAGAQWVLRRDSANKNKHIIHQKTPDIHPLHHQKRER